MTSSVVGESPFAMAAFHPDAAADLDDPERLIPFLRRTPDPTIQLVRQEALERVRGRHPQGTAFVDPQLFSAQAFAQEEDADCNSDRHAQVGLRRGANRSEPDAAIQCIGAGRTIIVP